MKKFLTAILCAVMLCSSAAAFTIEDISSEEIFTPEFIEKEAAELEKQEEQEQASQVLVFTDVPTTAYYYQPVMWAVANGITSGTTATTFSPNNICTNAHILTFMWRAAGSPEPAGKSPFINLTGQEYYAKAAVWAYEKDMISGTTFDANKACTRAMTMEYFWKQARNPKTAISDKFTDVPATASYAQAVAWGVANGVTAGTSDSTFSPDNTCTRGQIVTSLYRALVLGQKKHNRTENEKHRNGQQTAPVLSLL